MKYIKHILFISFFIVICSEQIQTYLPVISARPLNGHIIIPVAPTFTLDNWFSGNYQDSLMKKYEYELNLHVPFVRLRNQIGYSFFGELKANDVEEGKNHHLYSTGYIASYLGQSVIHEDSIINKVTKLAYVQAELKKRNIDLITLVPPGKPSIMPEYIADKWDLSKKARSNYDVYIQQFEKQNINYIDYRAYFLKLKPHLKYPLFAKLGFHWSGYGATLAADTLINYMQRLRKFNPIVHYQLKGTATRIPRDTDNDLGELLNIINPITSDTLYYPNTVFIKDKTKTKPNVLIVGDSFVWSWIGACPIFKNMFGSQSDYWFYNHNLAYTNGNSPANNSVASYNLKEQTLHRDFILLVYNEANIWNLGDGFIEQMYALLKAENAATAKAN